MSLQGFTGDLQIPAGLELLKCEKQQRFALLHSKLLQIYSYIYIYIYSPEKKTIPYANLNITCLQGVVIFKSFILSFHVVFPGCTLQINHPVSLVQSTKGMLIRRCHEQFLWQCMDRKGNIRRGYGCFGGYRTEVILYGRDISFVHVCSVKLNCYVYVQMSAWGLYFLSHRLTKSCSDSTGALSPRDSTPADSNLLSYDNLFWTRCGWMCCVFTTPVLA